MRFMRRARLVLLVPFVLSACVSSGSSRLLSDKLPTAPQPRVDGADASYDWHVLLLEPLGVMRHDVKLPLHEVILFHDGTMRPQNDNQECYSLDDGTPRFLGERLAGYLMCFEHDRLARVEATVQLSAAAAAPIFARACSRWLKSAGPMPLSGAACDGRDGDIAFSARLDRSMDEAAVSMILRPVGAAEVVHEASDGP